jgi:hypothetical protein
VIRHPDIVIDGIWELDAAEFSSNSAAANTGNAGALQDTLNPPVNHEFGLHARQDLISLVSQMWDDDRRSRWNATEKDHRLIADQTGNRVIRVRAGKRGARQRLERRCFCFSDTK